MSPQQDKDILKHNHNALIMPNEIHGITEAGIQLHRGWPRVNVAFVVVLY